MTELNGRWAWRNIEAAADGTLSPREERRMRAALRHDAALRGALERARGLRGELRRLGDEPPPRSLYPRLLAIGGNAGSRPREIPPGSAWSWASAGAAACVLAAVWLVVAQPTAPRPDRGDTALREFEIAMGYLHHSYRVAGEHVQRAMTRELREALEIRNPRGTGGRRDENGG